LIPGSSQVICGEHTTLLKILGWWLARLQWPF